MCPPPSLVLSGKGWHLMNPTSNDPYGSGIIAHIAITNLPMKDGFMEKTAVKNHLEIVVSCKKYLCEQGR